MAARRNKPVYLIKGMQRARARGLLKKLDALWTSDFNNMFHNALHPDDERPVILETPVQVRAMQKVREGLIEILAKQR